MDIELKQHYNALKTRFEKINNFDIDALQIELSSLEEQMQTPEIWGDQKKASQLGSQIRDIKDNLEFLTKWQGILDDTSIALEIQDEDLLSECAENLNLMETALDKFEIKQMLSGEYDEADAILTINAGAGGTDAQDWASLLLRMYTRWVESKGWKFELLDKLDGDEAGIKSATIKIMGKFAFGYAKAEKGVHRLVRISPFNANGKRQTSFASVEVSTIIEDFEKTIIIVLKRKKIGGGDRKIDGFFHADLGSQ